MKIKVVLVLFVVLGINVYAWAQLPAEWKNAQTLRIDRAGWVKISLPIETLSAAKPDLEDLRLLDPAGKEIAYLIERPVQAAPAVKQANNLSVTLENTRTVAIFYTGLKAPVGSLTIETPAKEFIKAVSVEGSSDNGLTWQMLVQNTSIFHRAETKRLQVTFPAGNRPKLKVIVDDSREQPIPITGISIHAVEKDPAPAEAIPITLTSREENATQSRLTLKLPGDHLTLAALTVETPEQLFTRKVMLQHRAYIDNEIHETILAQSTLYRIAVTGLEPVSCLGFAEDVKVPSRELILTIQNNDSTPLPITAIQGFRRPVYLLFLSSGPMDYRLVSGNPDCPAPRYDLTDLKTTMNAAELTAAVFSPLSINPAWKPPETLPEVGESGTPIDLSKWKYKKPVVISRPGVQRMELDAEVLDLSLPSLQDLRLVKNGRQLPYLIERSWSQRDITPELEKADDPKHPSISRWQLTVPYKRLPLTALECEIGTTFFKRQVTVSEEIPDHRGNLKTVIRGSGIWSRTIGEKKKKLFLPLCSQMVTGRLILTIDNGDNPSLDIKSFRLTYPISRLLFKSSSREDTFLYFGNPAANLPHYDITLIADHFLSAEKSQASLLPLDKQEETSWQKKYRFSEKAIWLFWIALGGLVVGLLVLISRLLPKPDP